MEVELTHDELAILEEIPEELREEARQEIIEERRSQQQQQQQQLNPPPPPSSQQQQQLPDNTNSNNNNNNDIEIELLEYPEELRNEVREQLLAIRGQNRQSDDFMETFNQMDPETQDSVLSDAIIDNLPQQLRERAAMLQGMQQEAQLDPFMDEIPQPPQKRQKRADNDTYDCISVDSVVTLVKLFDGNTNAVDLCKMVLVNGSSEFVASVMQKVIDEYASAVDEGNVKGFESLCVILDFDVDIPTKELAQKVIAAGVKYILLFKSKTPTGILSALHKTLKNSSDISLSAEDLGTVFIVLINCDDGHGNLHSQATRLMYQLLLSCGPAASEAFLNAINTLIEPLHSAIMETIPALTPGLGVSAANDAARKIGVKNVLDVLDVFIRYSISNGSDESNEMSMQDIVYNEVVVKGSTSFPAPASLAKLIPAIEEFLTCYSKASEEKAPAADEAANDAGNAGGAGQDGMVLDEAGNDHDMEPAVGERDDADHNPGAMLGINRRRFQYVIRSFPRMAPWQNREQRQRNKIIAANIMDLVELFLLSVIFFDVGEDDEECEPQPKKAKLSNESCLSSNISNDDDDDDDDAASDNDLLQASNSELLLTSSSDPVPKKKAKLILVKFFEDRKDLLEKLMEGWKTTYASLSFDIVILVAPELLDFKMKQMWFRAKVRMLNRSHMSFHLNVSRDSIYEDSLREFRKVPIEVAKGKLDVNFIGKDGSVEGSADAGGPTREWYAEISRHIVNTQYGLFIRSDDGAVQPNPDSGSINTNHLDYFNFVGKVVGKALWDGNLLNAHFTRGFYKQILGRKITMRDMEALDHMYYKGLMELHNGNADDFGVTFSEVSSVLGKTKTIDLVPNGRNIDVTNENKDKYIRRVVRYKLVESIKRQMNEFMKGLNSFIPPILLHPFDEKQIEILISGLPELDLEDLKKNTVFSYNQPRLTSKEHREKYVQWFWRAVESFTPEERIELLQFVTGTSSIPANGFGELKSQGKPFKVVITSSTESLPVTHTCFNMIEIPSYESYEVLREKLYIAVKYGYKGFGFL